MRRWVIFALVFGLAAAMFVLGYLAHRNEWIPLSARGAARALLFGAHATDSRHNRPFHGDAFPLQDRRNDVDSETKDALAAMGYARASQPATDRSGVIKYDKDAAYNGLNLCISAHAPEAVLMDMNGAVLHAWRCTLREALPGYTPPAYVREAARESWRRAYVCSDGSVLAIFEGMALIKLDKDSKVLWTYAAGCHHDLSVTPAGQVYVLTSEMRDGMIDNGVALLDQNGRELKRLSLLDCLRASPYASLQAWLPKRGDVLHTNAVKRLDGTHADKVPAFADGNLLVSMLELNTIAVVDPEMKTMPWALTGLTKAQHEPTLLANGNLLVFDNRGAGDRSRVLEINPSTHEIAWQYPPPGGAMFYSEWCGSAQRLPNGNTLVTETDNGRAFEVTPDGRIVWEFVNPHQFDEKGVRMVAALFDVVRLDSDYAASWLRR